MAPIAYLFNIKLNCAGMKQVLERIMSIRGVIRVFSKAVTYQENTASPSIETLLLAHAG